MLPEACESTFAPSGAAFWEGLGELNDILRGLLLIIIKLSCPFSTAVLFVGPPGSGKTALALAIAKELGVSLSASMCSFFDNNLLSRMEL